MDLGRPYTVICPTVEGPVLDVLAHTTRPLTGREIEHSVEPANNHAERALTSAVIYRELSLGSQSMTKSCAPRRCSRQLETRFGAAIERLREGEGVKLARSRLFRRVEGASFEIQRVHRPI